MGKLADFNINEVAGAVSLFLGGLGGLLLIIFKSRCSTITCCWGLYSCVREVPDADSDEDTHKTPKPALPSSRT